jgi:excisionase family DNA binding protein
VYTVIITAERGESNMNLVHSIPEACVLACTGRTAIYQAINSGELIAHKRGKRTLIFANDLQRWLDALPQIELKHPVERTPVSATPQVNGPAPAGRKDHS